MVYLFAVVGVVLLYLEFFLPGGILAFFSGIALILSIYFFCLQQDTIFACVLYTVILSILGMGVFALALRQIRASKNAFCLQNDQEGYVSSSMPNLMQKEGVVICELKPSGHVEIEGKPYQAVSQGLFIPQGSRVEVILVKGSHVVVQLKK